MLENHIQFLLDSVLEYKWIERLVCRFQPIFGCLGNLV